MKKIHFFSFLMILFVALNSCNDYSETDLILYPNSEVQTINYGTSFGMCAGYCKRNFEINPITIELTQSSWDKSVAIKRCKHNFSIESYKELLNSVNIQTFKTLDDVYGCPDCADGGAEYVEFIFLNGSKKRVTFEYWNEPAQLKNIVQKLRGISENFVACGVI